MQLADSLALRLLHELGRRGRGVGATRGASLGSASVDAMRSFLSGEQLLRHNRFAEARDAYESAVASDSTFALAFHRLRTVNSALGEEFDAASRVAALRAGRLNHGLAPRDSLLILADSLQAPLTGMLVWDPTSEAQERRRFTVLETAARLYPRDPEIWEQLGEARIHFGDRVGATPEQALAAFEQAVALDPGYNPPYFHVIELAAEMRSVDSVARLVAQVRASAPDDSRYRVLAPMLKDLATGHFTAALPRDGPRLEDVVSAAYLLHRWMGDPFASEQLLRAVLESPRADAGPLRETVRNRLVNELLYHAKPDEAARAFAEALRIDPADADAHNSFGNLLAQLGKHEEAVRQFEAAVRLKPDYAGAHNNLAISCKKLGRIGEAIAHYREAIRAQPESVEAINNLAWLLAAHPEAQFRNGAEAVQLATRACELTKYQNPVALTTLAAAYAETGQFQTAVSFAERAQELAKGGQGASAERLSAMLEAFRAGHPYHAG